MISGKTSIFGIFGHPVEHSFSPGMHNAAFAAIGLDGCYVPFAVHPDVPCEVGDGFATGGTSLAVTGSGVIGAGSSALHGIARVASSNPLERRAEQFNIVMTAARRRAR